MTFNQAPQGDFQAGGIMRFWSHAASRKFFIYPLILFFILTPFLSSCSSSSDSDDAGAGSGPGTVTTSDTLAEAADSQNESAQTAMSGAMDMAGALDSGLGDIEDAFGSTSPSSDDIEDYVEDYPDEAQALLARLETLAETASTAADNFSAAIAAMEAQEKIISRELGEDGTTSATGARRKVQAIGAGTALLLLGIFSGLAGAAKGATDALHECDYLPESTPQEVIAKLQCIIYKWPKATEDAVKGTFSSVATTVVSWAAGVQEWKTVKFIADTAGAVDSYIGISEAFGIRRCDQMNGNLYAHGDMDPIRHLQSLASDDLSGGDVYYGTSTDGTFQNVPAGNWTFLLMEKDHLRLATQCVEADGSGTVQVPVTMTPLTALSDDDKDGYTEAQGDCDDTEASVHPGATENCGDGVDNDCNGLTDCDDGACASSSDCQGGGGSTGTVVTANVSIPGYGTFSPVLELCTLASCSDSNTPFPAVYATTGSLAPNQLDGDNLTVALNDELGTGTWSPGTGLCDTPSVLFYTEDIVDEGSNIPVVFYAESGSITLTAYGTDYGDRLTGSFSVNVVGEQQLCPTSECDSQREIRGSITGSFDGIITNKIQ